MRHMLAGENIGLVSMRQTVGGRYTYAGVTRTPTCHGTFYLGNRGQDYIFPLYLYPENGPQAALGIDTSEWPAGPGGRAPNVSRPVVAAIEERLGLTFRSDGSGDLIREFGPEDLFYYSYAILNCPSFRQRYEAQLARDFPRIQFTSNADLFRKLVSIGQQLADLHLFEARPAVSTAAISFPVPGDNLIGPGFPQYRTAGEHGLIGAEELQEGRVYINAEPGQYFGGVEPDVWDFEFGGYKICEKWLKDRKGTSLTFDDQEHYKTLLATARESRLLFERVDETVPSWPLS